MKFVICSVKDSKGGFNSLHLEANDSIAMRNFANSCMQVNSVMNNFAGDFSLVRLGTFDSDTGEILIEENKEICNGKDIIRREEAI